MSALAYDQAVRMFATGDLAWETDDIRVLLVTDRYEPSIDDQSRVALGVAELVPSGGYRSGGGRLEGRSVGGADGTIRLDGAAVAWSGVSGEFRYAVVYKALGADMREEEPLVSVADLGVQRVANADLTVQFTDGVCVFEVVRGG